MDGGSNLASLMAFGQQARHTQSSNGRGQSLGHELAYSNRCKIADDVVMPS